MFGFISPNHKPDIITFSIIWRNLKGSSLITKYNGQRLNLDDLNIETLSTFQVSERLFGLFSKAPGTINFLYSKPS